MSDPFAFVLTTTSDGRPENRIVHRPHRRHCFGLIFAIPLKHHNHRHVRGPWIYPCPCQLRLHHGASSQSGIVTASKRDPRSVSAGVSQGARGVDSVNSVLRGDNTRGTIAECLQLDHRHDSIRRHGPSSRVVGAEFQGRTNVYQGDHSRLTSSHRSSDRSKLTSSCGH